VGVQVDATVVGVGFGVESHQVSSLWKLDTSGSIPNRMLPEEALMSINSAEAHPAYAFFLDTAARLSKLPSGSTAVGGRAA
jgi:hypothetical protein